MPRAQGQLLKQFSLLTVNNLILRIIGGGMLLLLAFAGSAHAEVVSADPANALVTSSPRSLRLTFDAPADAEHTAVSVFTSNHEPVAVGPLRSSGDPRSLLLDLPALAPGVYTVVWRAGSPSTPTAATSGAYAFVYDPSQQSPQVVVQPQPQFALAPLERVIPRWLVYTAVLTALGSLALRVLVWSPVLREFAGLPQSSATWRATVERRLTWIAAGALLLWVPSTLAQIASEAATASKRPFAAGFDPAVLVSYLTAPGAGWLWTIRLGLITAACVAFVLAVLAQRNRSALGNWLVLATLGLCGGELLVRTLPGDLSSDTPRAVFTWLLDWAHLVGAGAWLGGLVALAATASLLRPSRGAAPGVALRVIRRFSNVALVCVGGLTLSGLWTAWIHVGSPELLLTTLYGRTLLLKLVAVMVLVVLGGVNLLHVLPRLEAARATDPDRPSLVAAALRHFRGLIAVEALLGVAILAIVPFLSGSARNQDAQLRSANLAQTAVVGTTPIELRPSALQPGLVEYDVVLPPGAKEQRVALSFESPQLGVPPTEVVAAARGNGDYHAAGLYTPIVGEWQVQVRLGQPGEERSATFPLSVRPDPVAPPPNRAPEVLPSVWLAGGLEVATVVGLLGFATWLSRWLAAALNRRSERTPQRPRLRVARAASATD
jgi:copper transport protein